MAPHSNRLARESSPYLLQHAHNPVDWYPWGDEAFDVARETGRPVFLSIGYSTCHWCHVMAEESFEDPEIAAVLNERFVAIKVDREERPDVDAVYMAATQALTGGGGWPMSVWLDHDRRPFLAGTYFPPRDGERGALRGFLSVLRDVAEAWEKTPGRVESVAVRLADAVRVALG
ncbi:MAG: thioredoxin domain-containing protein, partial [Anaeromyxobacteraceae bacterium]